MKRLPLANLMLLVVVVALAAVVYLKTPREETATLALSVRLPAHATTIRIERPGNPVITIERMGDVWRLTAPVSAEADAFQIQRLLALLTARSPQRIPASHLERFELDRPRSKLVIDDEVFAFGMVNAVSGEQYVLARDAVYAIEARYGSTLPVNAMELVRKQLLSSSEAPLRFEMGTFTVDHRAGSWHLAPANGALSQDDLARWVENWRLAAALRVAALTPKTELGAAMVALKSGASVKFGIVQRAPELVIAREDEGLQYHFPAVLARRLLQPPAGDRDEREKQK